MSSNPPEIGITEEDRAKMKAAAISRSPDDLLPDGEFTSPLVDGTYQANNAADDDADNQREYPGESDEISSRQYALNSVEFERLLIGASRMGGDSGLEAWAAIVILGRLGLRSGELAHFDASWIDTYEGIINIPGSDPCEAGRNGGVCGECKQAIKQRIRHGDERSFDEIADDYWMPKTAASVRSIPYEWSARTEESLRILLTLHGGWPHSRTTLKRRLHSALEVAPGLSKDSTTIHGLRATAASYHASNGLNREALKQMMGWTDDQTPTKYLKINGQMTRRALAEVYR